MPLTAKAQHDVPAGHGGPWARSSIERMTSGLTAVRTIVTLWVASAGSAMEGWQRARSQEDWVRTNEQSQEEYESGVFLLERLAADRHLDPKLTATIPGTAPEAHRRVGVRQGWPA